MERLHFDQAEKYDAIEASIHLNRYLAAKSYVSGMKVLDVACGEGYGSNLMKTWGAKSVIGVDVSKEALEKANKNFAQEGVEFINHSAEELPFEDNSFDVVISLETIEHLDHPEKFIQEIKRVVKPDGTILISCPNDYYYAQNDKNFNNPYHKKRYTWFEFKELVELVLGAADQWYFGTALNGYMNLPLEKCILPEEDGLPKSMNDMMNFTCLENVFEVAADKYINHWNSCYYVGVWRKGGLEGTNAVIFPREIFALPQDSNPYIEMKQWMEQERDELIRCAKKSEIERERISKLLILAEKEKAHLWGRIGELQKESDYLHFLQGSKAFKLVMKFWRMKDRVKKLLGKK